MSIKHLRTISLLLPLVAFSATAHAGSTITDKSYWPNEAKRSTQSTTVGSPSDAFAYDRAGPPRLAPAPAANDAGSAGRYQGGPKGR
jgi:hypothetical protein